MDEWIKKCNRYTKWKTDHPFKMKFIYKYMELEKIILNEVPQIYLEKQDMYVYIYTLHIC